MGHVLEIVGHVDDNPFLFGEDVMGRRNVVDVLQPGNLRDQGGKLSDRHRVVQQSGVPPLLLWQGDLKQTQ